MRMQSAGSIFAASEAQACELCREGSDCRCPAAQAGRNLRDEAALTGPRPADRVALLARIDEELVHQHDRPALHDSEASESVARQASSEPAGEPQPWDKTSLIGSAPGGPISKMDGSWPELCRSKAGFVLS